MNTLRTAIAGLTLLAGTTLVRADVITDWTQTAIDVMRAVNVAGNPFTRTLAMVHVSMSDSINAVQDRYTRFTPDIAADLNASAAPAADAAALLAIRDGEALGNEGGEPIPSGSAAQALERPLRARLQRDQGLRRREEREAHRRAVRRGALLAAGQFFHRVVPGRRADLGP